MQWWLKGTGAPAEAVDMDVGPTGAAGGGDFRARIAQIQAQLALLTGPAPVATPASRNVAEGTRTSAAGADFAAQLALARGATPATGTAPRPVGPSVAPSAGAAVRLPEPRSPSGEDWTLPVDGRISSSFGMRRHPLTGVVKLHTGVDLAASSGTPIRAAGSGVVTFAGRRGSYGNTVVIDHGDGTTSLYAHASALLVEKGDRVRAGESVARVGTTGSSTGPHLHLEVRRGDEPVDPLRWLRAHGVRP